jgi:hypothetical protein
MSADTKRSTWCVECDAQQYILPNGEHACNNPGKVVPGRNRITVVHLFWTVVFAVVVAMAAVILLRAAGWL